MGGPHAYSCVAKPTVYSTLDCLINIVRFTCYITCCVAKPANCSAKACAVPTVLQNQPSVHKHLFLSQKEQDVQDVSIGASVKNCVLHRSSREDPSVYTYITPTTPMFSPPCCKWNLYRKQYMGINVGHNIANIN